MSIDARRLACLAALALVGCIADPRKEGVRHGMTFDDVRAIMGEPDKVFRPRCPEGARVCIVIWRFDGRNVTFENGLVDGF